MNTSNRTKPLMIRDEIHGDMAFDHVLRFAVDHECFQRLRYIKQLGLAEYVFPCANHSRFQHSLGAAYLAGQTYLSVVKNWLNSPFRFDSESRGTRFLSTRTFDCVYSVAEHPLSYEFWWQIASLAGLLHDVGHGPWSHTFEQLDLPQDFRPVTSQIDGAIGKYFRSLSEPGMRLQHEDISVLYIFRILRDLGQQGVISDWKKYFLSIATLVNRKMLGSEVGAEIENEVGNALNDSGTKGGLDFHRLLRPIISGPFDIDRMDYIQRDGRNCGVSIGGIEWRRLIRKLLPCLAEHPNDKGEPEDVILISNMKNQHVLDDFIFSLFQMYAQVYMHPKIVGFEETIKDILSRRQRRAGEKPITLERHQSFSDYAFRVFLREELGLTDVDSILLRKPSFNLRVASYPPQSGMEDELRKAQFTFVDTQDRPMMKDSVGVFLFNSYRKEADTPFYFLRPWSEVSPIARQFSSISYSPDIWLRRGD